MPRKERCKRIREELLNEAASSVPKLSRFGFTFTKISDKSAQDPRPSSLDPIASSSASSSAEDTTTYIHAKTSCLASDFPNTAVSDSALELTPEPPFTEIQSTSPAGRPHIQN